MLRLEPAMSTARPDRRSATGAPSKNVGRLVANPFKDVPRSRREGRPSPQAPGDDRSRASATARRRPPPTPARSHDGAKGQDGRGKPSPRSKPEVRERLEALGRERALIYKTLVLSGLRKNELATLSVAQLRLDDPVAYVELDAEDEKNREGNSVIIRADLADDLRAWLADKLAALQADAFRRGEPIPSSLPGDSPVFNVPTGLIRIFDRDLTAAGDRQARRPGPHARRACLANDLRHALEQGRVCPLRTAQAAMRHSDPSLTANVYTDPKLLDVHGALDALPNLPLDAGPIVEQERLRATGTETYGRSFVAPSVALTDDKRGQTERNADKMLVEMSSTIGSTRFDATPNNVRGKTTMSIADKACSKWAMRDSNPRHPACKAGALTN